MDRDKNSFTIGLILGMLISALFFYFLVPRYTIVTNKDEIIKQDKWSGISWQLYNKQWITLEEAGKRNLNQIDQILVQALNIKPAAADKKSALVLLKEKYPLLKTISDDELNERIKNVYSKEILCNLYLDNFLKVQKNK